jgi:hypothetical protein
VVLLAPPQGGGTVPVVAITRRFRCEEFAERVEALREMFSQGDEPTVDDSTVYRFEAAHPPREAMDETSERF